MQFNGFGFSGYRSIGDELVKIAPLKKINLIIGQNNSGKSNILTFLKNHLPRLHKQIQGNVNGAGFSDIDRHISNKPAKSRIAFPFKPEGEELESYLAETIPNGSHYGRDNQESRYILKKITCLLTILSNWSII